MLRRWSVTHLTWKKENTSYSSRGAVVDGLSYQRGYEISHERDDSRRSSDPGFIQPSTELHRNSLSSSISSISESSDNAETKLDVSCNTLGKSLHKAVKQNKQNKVLKSLDKGASARYKSNHGHTPLHTAVVAAASRLISARAENIEMEEDNNFPIIDLLFSHGCDPFVENQTGKTPLHYAVMLRNSNLVTHLLCKAKQSDNGSSFQVGLLKKDHKGRTVFHLACTDLEDVKDDMLEMMKTCSKKDRNKITTLLMESETTEEKLKVLQVLLQFPNQWNSPDSNGISPLKYALKSEDYHTVSVILRAGADCNMEDIMSVVPFERKPTEKDHTSLSEISKDMLTKVFQGSNDWCYLAHSAAEFGCTKLVKYFHERFKEDFITKSDEFGFIPLHYAVQNNHLDIAKYLISENSSIFARNHAGQTSFHLALESSSIEMIDCLLKQCSDKTSCTKCSTTTLLQECNCRQCLINSQDNKGQTALHLLSKRNDHCLDIFKLLLNNSGNLSIQDFQGLAIIKGQNQKGDTLLTTASRLNDVEGIELLLKLGANPTTRNNEGYSAIDYVVLHQNVEMLKLCLFHLRINSPTGFHQGTIYRPKCWVENCISGENCSDYVNGIDLLYRSIHNNQTEMTELLLFSGFALPNPEENVDAPLHIATKKGDLYTMIVLLETEANVNALNKQGETALHLACSTGNMEAVQLLLKYNADVSLKTSVDSTPDQYAEKGDHLNILKALKNHAKGSNKETAQEEVRPTRFSSFECKEVNHHLKADSAKKNNFGKNEKKAESKRDVFVRRYSQPAVSIWNKNYLQNDKDSASKQSSKSESDNQKVQGKLRRSATDISAIALTQGKINFQVDALKSRCQQQSTLFLKEQRNFLEREASELNQRYQEATRVSNSCKMKIENLETTLNKERRSACCRDVENKQNQDAMRKKMDSQETAIANLTKENNSLKMTASMAECRVCMDSLCNVVLLPCHHFVLCQGCASKIIECPLCRQRVTKSFTVFT